jgi:hypothetical protein
VLYLRYLTPEAIPTYISGRTSYFQARLAFHLYPQLIPQICNSERFGPPRDVTLASPWPWIARLVSGLIPATKRPIKTRFRYGSGYKPLNLATEINSPDHSPKGTSSGVPEDDPKVINPGIALRLLVGTRFQVLFIPLKGVLFTFPSRY